MALSTVQQVLSLSQAAGSSAERMSSSLTMTVSSQKTEN